MQNDDEDLEIDPESEANFPGESAFDAFQPEPIQMSKDEEGFPVEHDPPGDPSVRSLTPANLCCMKQDDGTLDCKWYARQLVELKDLGGHKYMNRICTHTAFKTLSGAGLILSDSAVFACSMRDPPHAPGLEDMDRRDKRTTARGKSTKKWPMFRTAEQAKAGVHTLKDDEYARGSDEEGAEGGAPDRGIHEPDRAGREGPEGGPAGPGGK
jgi:hypothetical protein